MTHLWGGRGAHLAGAVVAAAVLLLLAVRWGTSTAQAQMELGAVTYQRHCSTCHGLTGRGLRSEAMHAFPDTHQVCAKCHDRGRIGFPGGVALLDSPAVVGPAALQSFRDSRQLYRFVSTSMPYLDPGVLSPDRYWAVVAHLVSQNGVRLRVPLTPLTSRFVPAHATLP